MRTHDETLSAVDEAHLGRCVQLARTALQNGDDPFGSLLVDEHGTVLAEDRNRVGDGDPTAHPEIALARWAAAHLDAATRSRCTVYTSGEHCPMCSAAHAWVGLGRIVYASSTAQLTAWREQWGLTSPVAALAVTAVAPGVEVAGPHRRLAQEVRALHAARLGIDDDDDG